MGVMYLCQGLEGNISVLSLSLCFCGLGIPSGKLLGNMISTTAVRSVFLNNNRFRFV